MGLVVFQKNIALLVAIAAIFSGLLDPVLSFDLAFATSEEEVGDTGNREDNGDVGGDDGGKDEPEAEPEQEPEPDPDSHPESGLIPGAEQPIDPCKENPEAEECILPNLCIEDPTAEGCEPLVCSCPPGERQDCPDIDCDPCIKDPSLPECEPLSPPPDGDCHPSYPGRCIPPLPPNLNCDDISFRNFKVVGSDLIVLMAIAMALVMKVVA
jgi:hypothetical protein